MSPTRSASLAAAAVNCAESMTVFDGRLDSDGFQLASGSCSWYGSGEVLRYVKSASLSCARLESLPSFSCSIMSDLLEDDDG